MASLPFSMLVYLLGSKKTNGSTDLRSVKPPQESTAAPDVNALIEQFKTSPELVSVLAELVK